jgi:excisionase family DNA binding protein
LLPDARFISCDYESELQVSNCESINQGVDSLPGELIAKTPGKQRPVNLEDFGDALSPDQARRVLGLGKSAMYEALRRGQVRSVKIGHKIIIPKAVLKEMLCCN